MVEVTSPYFHFIYMFCFYLYFKKKKTRERRHLQMEKEKGIKPDLFRSGTLVVRLTMRGLIFTYKKPDLYRVATR